MRLIDTETMEFQDYFPSQLPEYAILSHTWGDDEVSFQDMSLPSRSFKKGFAKVVQTCRLVRNSGLKFAWVDACCIEKSSSAELTETINSMFQWYKNAVVCYVFLEDLNSNTLIEDGLPQCRWLTRGWTLQELLAPTRVEFYDEIWTYRGSKLDLIGSLSMATRIPSKMLNHQNALESYSIAMRMSWAARRQPTRTEDMAYCLLGIFNVNMSLIYGEGQMAFRRLQEEIVRRNTDLTILAWDAPRSPDQLFSSLFATSPAAFEDSGDFWLNLDDLPSLSVTNIGPLISGDVPLWLARVHEGGRDDAKLQHILLLGGTSKVEVGGIHLRKVGPRLFYRDAKFSLAGFGKSIIDVYRMYQVDAYRILIDPGAANLASSLSFRQGVLHVPHGHTFKLDATVPENLWDATDRLFLRPNPYTFARCLVVLAIAFHGIIANSQINLVVLVDCRISSPQCTVFLQRKYWKESAMLFDGKFKQESIFWEDMHVQAPDLMKHRPSLKLKSNSETFTVTASTNLRKLRTSGGEVEVNSLSLDIEKE